MSKARAAIIAAATTAFLRDGYEVGMEQIAAEAGVVRKTIYNLFKSKAHLFVAVTMHLIGETSPGDILAFDRQPDSRMALTRLGEDYIGLMLDPRSIQMYRVLVSLVSLDPALAREVLSNAGDLLAARLATYLEAQTTAGRLTVGEPRMAAEQFLGMVLGQSQMRAMHGYEIEPRARMHARVEAAVTAFLGHYQTTAAITPSSTADPGSP